MNTNSFFFLIVPFSAGAMLSLFFFSGLWLTLKKGLNKRNAGFWLIGSFLLRTGSTLAGFYWISAGHWENAVASLIGFSIVRYLVVPRIASSGINRKEAVYETQP